MQTKKIDLALQGGGAHGAYSWGIIDRLLDRKNVHLLWASALQENLFFNFLTVTSNAVKKAWTF